MIQHTQQPHLRVTLIGRTNVGKSTLFNRLIHRPLSLVKNQEGVTRDRREELCPWEGVTLKLVDTGGMGAALFQKEVQEQIQASINEGGLVLFVVDGQQGLTALDQDIAVFLRHHATCVRVVINKSEGHHVQRSGIAHEVYKLGFGDPILISAAHGEGISHLIELFLELTPTHGYQPIKPELPPQEGLKVVFLGRPNVGKSTLINALLGYQRFITSELAGTTREALSTPWIIKNQDVWLTDTAGVRTQRSIHDPLEKLSVASTLQAVRQSHVVVVVIDATTLVKRSHYVRLLEKQDALLSHLVLKEGRGLIYALNKWDKVTQTQEVLRWMKTTSAHASDAPYVEVSAQTRFGLENLTRCLQKIDERWRSRQSTSQLNAWLQEALNLNPPPYVQGRSVRLKHIRHLNTSPPTYGLFGNRLEVLPEAYLTYLTNSLRRAFSLQGVPIRWVKKTSHNPYIKVDS